MEMKKVNPNCEIIKVSRSPEKVIRKNNIIRKIISQDANHCLYDPKSSYEFVSKSTKFLEDNLITSTELSL